MQDFSKIIRHRLGARPEPQDHPDADTLSAYAEQALSAGERRKVIAHLAACGICRDVVVLSYPQLQEQQVVWSPVGRSRFWALGIRWGAAVATLAVAATLVVEKPWQHRLVHVSTVSSAPAANNQPASAPAVSGGSVSASRASESSASPAAPSQAASAQSDISGNEVAANSRRQRPTTTSRNDVNDRIAGSTAVAPRNRLQAQTAARATAPAMGFAASAGQGGGVMGGVATQRDFVNKELLALSASDLAQAKVTTEAAPIATNVAMAPEPKAARSARADAKEEFRRAVPPPISLDHVQSLAAAPVPSSEKVANAPAPPTAQPNRFVRIWSGVKKSVEGATSQASNSYTADSFASPHVRFTPPPLSSRSLAASGQESSHWSISPDGKLLTSPDMTQWHEAYPQDQDLHFRVVVTEGHEIWAGGSRLTLIHSWDGVQWEKLKVSDTGTGDITTIKIDDDNVQVKTSSGQTLVSPDHGKTWVPLKQNEQPK